MHLNRIGPRDVILAALAASATLLSLSCTGGRNYDDDPSFVRELASLRTGWLPAGEGAPTASTTGEGSDQPADLPWWHDEAGKPLLAGADQKRPTTLDDVYLGALLHSHQISVFADTPLIRETGIREAQGAFDVHAYVQSQFDRLNEPVGNTQVSRTRDRFIEDETSFEFGFRKKLITGADVSIGERFADKDSNADYFVPERQATSMFTARFVQPLLAGAGARYNTSILRVAQIDSEIAGQELSRQAESHLLEVARAYWSLYAARAVHCQYMRQTLAVEGILKELKGRADADAVKKQILRAESALTDRRADLVRAEVGILNAQDRLHALINEEGGWSHTEIIPTAALVRKPLALDSTKSANVALEKRAEIQQAFLQVRAAAVRLGMNRNEVMPKLNLILEGRLAGLHEGWDLGGAGDDQWDGEQTGGTVGLVFDLPLGNNTAGARLLRREIEMRQQYSQLRTTVDTVLLEVRISVREVDTGWRDLQAKSEAAKATREEVEYLLARKDLAAMKEPASRFLEDLLEAQDRQTTAERALAQALATYQVALLNLQRAQGTLLESASIRQVRSGENDLPTIRLQKAPPAEPPKEGEKK